MATYRQPQFLRTALLSCFNQTYPNFELVVVSVEGDSETEEVLENFPLEFRWLRSGKANYVHQRNLGVRASRSRWFCLADSDDVYLPNKLSSDLEFAKKEDALIVYSRFLIADEKLNVKQIVMPAEFSRDRLLKGCMITDFSLVSKRLYEEFGPYDEELGEVAFYDFYLKVSEHYPNRIKLNPTPTFIYRRYPKQMSKELDRHKKLEIRMNVVKRSIQRETERRRQR